MPLGCLGLEFPGLMHIFFIREVEGPHVFALTSFTEARNAATMQAVPMEVPVMATHAGDMPELINHQTDGFLIPPTTNLPPGLAHTAVLKPAGPSTAGRDLCRSWRASSPSKWLNTIDCLI